MNLNLQLEPGESLRPQPGPRLPVAAERLAPGRPGPRASESESLAGRPTAAGAQAHWQAQWQPPGVTVTGRGGGAGQAPTAARTPAASGQAAGADEPEPVGAMNNLNGHVRFPSLSHGQSPGLRLASVISLSRCVCNRLSRAAGWPAGLPP